MNFFFSVLVIDRPRKPIQLVSLAIVNEAGEAYYAESGEFNIFDASEDKRSIICANLDQTHPKKLATIAREAQAFVGDSWVKFWAYNEVKEFEVLCRLLFDDDSVELWPNLYSELKDELQRNPPGMEEMQHNHHALANAQWVRDTWLWLRNRQVDASPGSGISE
jgi:hypothetical protein